MKKFSEKFEHEKFKMETIPTVTELVRPGMFMAKFDIKDAKYNIPVLESRQKHSKFNYNNGLYRYNLLPNGYTEGHRKFKKLLKPALLVFRKEENVLLAVCFDDLITLSKNFRECFKICF